MAYNPYGVQYGQGSYQQRELLPNFRQTPPPEVLNAQINNHWNEDIKPFLKDYGVQVAANTLLAGLTGATALGWGMRGAGKLLANPRVQAGIGALESTKYGRPLVTNIRSAANHPYTQKVVNYLDWIF